MIVDTPGYGYIFAPISYKEKWKKMVFKYLGFGVRVNLIVFLVNAHIGLKNSDIKMLEDLQNFRRPIQVVLTKLDKVESQTEMIRFVTETS
jgi:GTP-binding protein